MAKDDDTIEVSGLQLSNNTFSASPPGSLLVAEECVMPQKGVIEPRRGQSRAGTLATAGTYPFAMTEFDGHLIVSSATGKTSTSYALGYLNGSSISAYSGSPFNPVDDDGVSTSYGRMKFGFAGEYLYFCTTSGPKALEAYNATPRNAGLIRMPDVNALMSSASNLGTNGVGLDYGKSRAYRSALRKPTSSGTSLLSPPSGAFVVRNELIAPIGAMTRTAGTTVTVNFPVNTGAVGLAAADTFTLDPGEANFPATAETVATAVDQSITYTDAGANVSNTVAQSFDTGPRPVLVGVFLTADATTSTPVRIYRTLDFDSTPDDEFFLVAEVFPSGSDISAGFLTYLDRSPEIALGDPLYTNPLTGEGPREVNNRPPVYRDTANWSSRQWYSNTTGLQSLRIQMLGVGSPDGVQNSDTITIDGTVFTFKTAASVAGDVQIISGGFPEDNIRQTAQNLVTEISEVFGSGTAIRGYYESAQNDSPGKILLEATTYSEAAFTVSVSRVKTWTPALPADSQAERVPNFVAYSKIGQPESVPPLNYLPVGAKNFAIARVLGLQQALLVFKEGDGIYAVTGAPPYNVQQISTANIIAPDAACVFADAAWVYTDEGFLRVSDSGGATCVSRQIETVLNDQLALLPDQTYDYSFTVPYETERRLMLFVPFELDGSQLVLRAWCYNGATQAWTGPLYSDAFSGVVSSTVDGFRRKRLYLGTYDNDFATTRITVERNGLEPDYKNYIDGSLTGTISTVSTDSRGNTILRLASTSGLSDGDLIAQSTAVSQFILRPDLPERWIQPVSEGFTWTAAACALSKHYDVTLQFQPQGSPSARKTLSRLAWLFKPEWFSGKLGVTLLASDQCQADGEVDTPAYGFGVLGFGSAPFGDPSPLVLDVNPLPAKQSNAAQFFPGFTTPIAWTKLKLQGFVLRLEGVEAPDGRGR